MKKNFLPNMQPVKISDKSGEGVSLSIEVRRGENGIYIFLSDSNQLGGSHLAQDAVHFFEKISQRLNLAPQKTTFYRHIYQEQMGSLFGRYVIDWNAEEGPSYRFHMLTNIDELHNVRKLLETTVKVDLVALASKKAVGA